MSAVRTAGRAAAWGVSAVILVSGLVQPGGLLGGRLAMASGGVSVSGSVTGLLPGVPADLVLTVENDGSQPVVVQRLRAVVAGGGTADCPTSALHVEPWRGRLDVPARGAASQALRITLDAAAECGDVTWELDYAAEVV